MKTFVDRIRSASVGWGEFAAKRYCHWIAVALVILVSFPLIPPSLEVSNDVRLYSGVVTDLASGTLPYRDRELEYPPFAILVFLPAGLFPSAPEEAFACWVMIGDFLLKLLLVCICFREERGVKGLIPLAMYCIAVAFLRSFYFQRYDIFPALMTTIALFAVCSESYICCGMAIAIGAGLKLYPMLFAPICFSLALRRHQAKRFMVGIFIGFAPICLLSPLLPWWQFLAFHQERGLQVESLYSSVLWLAKLLGLVDVCWRQSKASVELTGEVTVMLLPWIRIVFITSILASSVIATIAALRLGSALPSQLARLFLVPLLAFVCFNQVLSPQYMIWLLPLAGIAVLSGSGWTVFGICAAAMGTPIFFPSAEYNVGLGFGQTVALLVRNILLVIAWCFLLKEALAIGRNTKPIP